MGYADKTINCLCHTPQQSVVQQIFITFFPPNFYSRVCLSFGGVQMVNWRWAINVYLAINYWKSLHNQCPACSRPMITKILSQNCDCHKNVTAATKTNRKLLSGLVWYGVDCGLWSRRRRPGESSDSFWRLLLP